MQVANNETAGVGEESVWEHWVLSVNLKMALKKKIYPKRSEKTFQVKMALKSKIYSKRSEKIFQVASYTNGVPKGTDGNTNKQNQWRVEILTKNFQI